MSDKTRSKASAKTSAKPGGNTSAKRREATGAKRREAMSADPVVAIIGAGKMGTALAEALLSAGRIRRERLTVTVRHAASAEALRERRITVRTSADNEAVARAAEVIILAVHPDETKGAIEQIRPALTADHLLISIVTGVSTARLESMAGLALPVVRANPNIAVLVAQSATVLCAGRFATEAHVALARSLFATAGLVEVLDERHMNASTGLGGCGPAFIFKILEAMAEGGVKMGLPRDVSQRISAQVLKGAAELVLKTGRHPAALKDEVTTPGGCTIDGIAKLQERGISIALIDAVEVSTRKAGALYGEQ
jgi:pyrroline-5-carboxylate reductase